MSVIGHIMRVSSILFLLSCSFADKSHDNKERIILTDRYEDGRIKSTMQMTKDSVLDGKSESYYSNGILKSVVFFKNDKPEGEMVTYYESGKVRSTISYLNGMQHGKTVYFYKNGNIEVKNNFYKGLEAGHQYVYYDNENNTIRIHDFVYLLGNKRKVNTSVEYDSSGRITRRTPYLEFSRDGDSLDIKLHDGKRQNMRAVVANYDFLFNLIDESTVDTINATREFKISLPYSDGDTLRGYVDNWDEVDQGMVSEIIHFSYPSKWK